MSWKVIFICFGTEGGLRLYLPLPDRLQTSVAPSMVLFIVLVHFVQENFIISLEDKRNCLTTRREILKLKNTVSVIVRALLPGKRRINMPSTLNIPTVSRLNTYTVLDDQTKSDKEKCTDIQFLVNKSLNIRSQKELKLYRLIIRFLPALPELEDLITSNIIGR
jgi:hypothetical protein